MKDIKEQISELREEFNRRIDELEKELTPEFKVGQWVKNIYGKVFRITRITGVMIDGIDYTMKNENFGNWEARTLRPATPQEIESHLRSICEAKGFKMGAKYRDLHGRVVEIIERPIFTYIEISDVLGIEGIDPTPYDIVYQDGKFAEILPSLKPKPETRDQFRHLLFLFSQMPTENMRGDVLNGAIDQLIDQYDIK